MALYDAAASGIERMQVYIESGTRPTLKDMLEDLKSITDWQILLTKLGMEKYNINKIEINHPGNVDLQKHDAFYQWLCQKHDACWTDIIKALFETEEHTLAKALERRYSWKDPRVSVDTVSHVNAPEGVRVTAVPIPDDLPCRKFLPSLRDNQEYFTLHTNPAKYRLTADATEHFARWIRENPREGHNLLDFLKSIEGSVYKSDFKVGLKARFGKMYWKLRPESVRAPSTRGQWSSFKLFRKAAFYPEVEESDVERTFMSREKLGKSDFHSITIKFTIEGQGEGDYSAVIANYGNNFYPDAVYRLTATENRVRINIALPGRKYDVRIADCTECILLEQDCSIPCQIVSKIVYSLCRLSTGKLQLILYGSIDKGQSIWKVKYIRQRKQAQYKWKPQKQWLLAQYDLDELDLGKNETVNIDSTVLNKIVDIPEFDCSRKEVELLGQQIFPKDVNKTHPSRDKYFYMEGIDGVRLPDGGEVRQPYNWTAEGLLTDFAEFLGDAFMVADILSGTPS